METKAEYEIHDGRKYPILWRKRGNKLTDSCPFCGQNHEHGIGEGHRVAHCSDTIRCVGGISEIVKVVSNHFAKEDGYMLREY